MAHESLNYVPNVTPGRFSKFFEPARVDSQTFYGRSYLIAEYFDPQILPNSTNSGQVPTKKFTEGVSIITLQTHPKFFRIG